MPFPSVKHPFRVQFCPSELTTHGTEVGVGMLDVVVAVIDDKELLVVLVDELDVVVLDEELLVMLVDELDVVVVEEDVLVVLLVVVLETELVVEHFDGTGVVTGA
jgi:hypothetical protein